ncbi:hypothetical protein LWM68_41035 [Niabella sp. W65]|nr:hypothetical protein [Niabella sp. W65]MCH7368559.1 hypothetical protein [Niabella sp. W65]
MGTRCYKVERLCIIYNKRRARRANCSQQKYKNFLAVPSNYKDGDTWTPAVTVNIGGTVYEAGDTYEATTAYAGSLVPSHWRLSNKTSYLKKVFGETTLVGNGVLMAGIVGAMNGGVVKSYMKAIDGDPVNIAGGVENFGMTGIETQSYALNHDGSAKFAKGNLFLNADGSISIAGGKFAVLVDGTTRVGGFTITADDIRNNWTLMDPYGVIISRPNNSIKNVCLPGGTLRGPQFRNRAL